MAGLRPRVVWVTRARPGADSTAAKLRDLGVEPAYERNVAPCRGNFQCDSMNEFKRIIREDLVAEYLAVQVLADLSSWLAELHPYSSDLLQQIRSVEDEHVSSMLTFLKVKSHDSADAVDPSDQSERPSEKGMTYAD